jgi:putative ABC transport system permease protein
MFTLALKSLLARKNSVLLTMLALCISFSLLLSVEQIRTQAKASFTRTISGVDLIVGPRTGNLNLLLSAVYHRGAVSSNITLATNTQIAQNKQVEWTIPISLGDTHAGFTVLGTNNAYFEYFQYGYNEPLRFEQGRTFAAANEAVLGANVAASLQYQLLDGIVLAHGLGKVSFKQHAAFPLKIVGILAATGTPVDDTVFVPLQGLELAHTHKTPATSKQVKTAFAKPVQLTNHASQDEHDKHPHDNTHEYQEDEHAQHRYGQSHNHKHQRETSHFEDLTPDDQFPLTLLPPTTPISAVYVGLTSPIAILSMQQRLNQNADTPLTAILPGVTLNELWQLVSFVERLLYTIAWLIVVTTTIGLTTMLLASMRERKREIAILRMIGASPLQVFLLIQLESICITIVSLLGASVFVLITLHLAADWLSATLGLYLKPDIFNIEIAYLYLGMMVLTCVCSLLPAIKAYRTALTNGLQ